MKSKDKTNKSKGYKGSEYKTKEERQEQVRNIINEITKLGLSIQYQPVKELYECLRSYKKKIIYLLLQFIIYMNNITRYLYK